MPLYRRSPRLVTGLGVALNGVFDCEDKHKKNDEHTKKNDGQNTKTGTYKMAIFHRGKRLQREKRERI